MQLKVYCEVGKKTKTQKRMFVDGMKYTHTHTLMTMTHFNTVYSSKLGSSVKLNVASSIFSDSLAGRFSR